MLKQAGNQLGQTQDKLCCAELLIVSIITPQFFQASTTYDQLPLDSLPQITHPIAK